MTSVRSRIQRHLIRRKRKLTILLRADRPCTHSPPLSNVIEDNSADADSDVNSSAEVVEIYDFIAVVSTCVTHWPIWYREAQEERTKALELVTQYPAPANLGFLYGLERLCSCMEKVC